MRTLEFKVGGRTERTYNWATVSRAYSYCELCCDGKIVFDERRSSRLIGNIATLTRPIALTQLTESQGMMCTS